MITIKTSEDLKKMRMNNQKGIFKSFVTCSKWDEDMKERIRTLLDILFNTFF